MGRSSDTTTRARYSGSFLIGRRFHLGLQRRHLHHIGRQRVSGSVPCPNSIMVGCAGIGGPIAESRDIPPHLADLYEWLARAVTGCSLNAEPESADPAFGPCQNHLAPAAGDRHQIDGCRRKDGRRGSVGHSSFSPHPTRIRSAIPSPSGREHHLIDSISWKACGTVSGVVRIMSRCLSYGMKERRRVRTKSLTTASGCPG